MKDVLKICGMAALLLVSTKVKAAEGFDVKISGNRILTVELDETEEGAILFFQNKNGEILFRDSLFLKEGYTKAFDLEVVPNGTYYLSLEKECSILTTEIRKTALGLTLKEKSSPVVFKPQFLVENDSVKVFLTNPGLKEASFEVYDSNGSLIDTIVYDDLVVKKTFDFSRVPTGEFTIIVRVNGKTFSRKMSVG